MQCKIFYSWQSDLKGSVARSFIEKALENAIKALRKDGSITIDTILDRDTKGVSGSPDIADTIFSKINECDVFVCDVSFINFNPSEGDNPTYRLTPNPNVMIELGYAIKTLTTRRVLMVMNTAFAPSTKPIESLPFDIRHRTIVTYSVPEPTVLEGVEIVPEIEEAERSQRLEERKRLESVLKSKLVEIVGEVEAQHLREQAEQSASPSPLERCLTAIGENRTSVRSEVKEFWKDLLARLDALKPDFLAFKGDAGEELVRVLPQVSPLLCELSLLSQRVVEAHLESAARQLYLGFEEVLKKYHPPLGLSQTYHLADSEFYRVCGCDMFLTFVAPFVKDEQWKWLGDLLNTEFSILNFPSSSYQAQSYRDLSVFADVLEHRNSCLRIDKYKLQGRLIKERHSEGDLTSVSPFEEITSADLFLFLYGECNRTNDSNVQWIPWTSCYVSRYHPPAWMRKIERLSYTNVFVAGLHLPDAETLRERMERSYQVLNRVWNHMDYDPPNIVFSQIGNRLD